MWFQNFFQLPEPFLKSAKNILWKGDQYKFPTGYVDGDLIKGPSLAEDIMSFKEWALGKK